MPCQHNLEAYLKAYLEASDRDAGAPEGVIADGRLDAGLAGTSLDHVECIAPRQRRICQLLARPAECGEERALGLAGTFNQRSTPELNGTVARIAVADEEQARLGSLKLVPGMPVEAFIKTGDRTVMSYLKKPLTDQMQRAFRED